MEGPGPVAEPVKQDDQSLDGPLVIGAEFDGSPRGADRAGRVALSVVLTGQREGHAFRLLAKPGSLLLQPLLQLGRAGNVEALEQISPVQLQCIGPVFRSHGLLEAPRVTPERLRISRKLLVPAKQKRALAEGTAQNVDALSQGGARVLLVGLWPEETQELVTPMESAGRGRSQVGQQSQAL